MKFHNLIFCGMLFAALAPTAQAGEATEAYSSSRIDARLNVEVKSDVDVVHFVRSNSDPDVITKTYILKNADPYEIRGYLREIVQTRKVDESDTGITAVKYNDGTGVLLISAEDYRFEDSEIGQGIDSIIELLDTPKITSATGQATYLYSPKYRAASELKRMVRTAGADAEGDLTESIGGQDRIGCDGDLNMMFFTTSLFSRKNIASVLEQYDRSYPEIRAKITVYEIYAENDAKIGLDFQTWKNNDGLDLFGAGGRFRQNYSADMTLARGSGWSDTKYFNFNPKWSSRYIDFLTSKGKAHVMHSCEITARHRTTSEINRTTQIFYAEAEKAEDTAYTQAYACVSEGFFYFETPKATPIGGGAWPADEVYVLSALSSKGVPIEIVNANPGTTDSLTIYQLAPGSRAGYYLELKNGGTFEVGGVNVGSRVEASVAEVTLFTAEPGSVAGNYSWESEPLEYDDSLSVAGMKGNLINLCPSDEFGFHMSVTPNIGSKATTLDITLSNSSLIGYKSNGEPRIQQGNNVSGSFMISNSGTKLVIGGLEKRDVVSVSGGIPILKDIPFLGWVFSTESESTKRSQLLVVAEVIPVRLNDDLGGEIAEKINNVNQKLVKAGESNTFTF